MPEVLRSELPAPTLHQETVHPANEPMYDERIAVGQNQFTRENSIMRQFPEIAHEVAENVKPEIDHEVELQHRIDNPYRHAMRSASTGGIVGAEDVPRLQLEKKATRADLERNAQKTVELATARGIGLTATKYQLHLKEQARRKA